MGLDAFLYPEEGVMLSRAVGSSPWMFPSLPKEFGLTSFAQVRIEKEKYEVCAKCSTALQRRRRRQQQHLSRIASDLISLRLLFGLLELCIGGFDGFWRV
jgi:hypothetical protein